MYRMELPTALRATLLCAPCWVPGLRLAPLCARPRAMARQLRALGRALYGVSAFAPVCAARAGAPLGVGSLRAFSNGAEEPPANGSHAALCAAHSACSPKTCVVRLLQAPLRRRWEIFARRWSAGCRVRARSAGRAQTQIAV